MVQSKRTDYQSVQTETSTVLADLEAQWDPTNFADKAAMKVPVAGNYWHTAEEQTLR